MKSLLEARNVTRLFGAGLMHQGTTIAVDDVSLIINEDKPSITAIAGESGSGKTTLARLLLGMIQPTSGSILFRGQNLTAMDSRARKNFRRQVQAIFQDPYEAYNPVYKVDQTLTTPVRKFKLASSKDDERAQIEDSLRRAGLRPEETLGRYPHQLSGGQRQRIMVARALLLNPRVLLADEPVSMVDASLRATILESLVKLKRELGISLIYITHDLTTAYQISQNVIVLYRGAVAEAGNAERVVQQPKHPYTRLLIGSIPLPDPEHPWQVEGTAAVASEIAAGRNGGCRFAPRCPEAMAICRQTEPPLFRVDADRATSCYLYRDAGVLRGDELGSVMADGEAVSPA